MSMFAETIIVNFSLVFASQGKQTSVFRFRFPYIRIYLYMYTYICIYIYTYTYMYIRGGDTYNPDDVNILLYVTLRGFVNKI